MQEDERIKPSSCPLDKGGGEIDNRVCRLYEYLRENPDDMDMHLELLECVRLRDGDEGVMGLSPVSVFPEGTGNSPGQVGVSGIPFPGTRWCLRFSKAGSGG